MTARLCSASIQHELDLSRVVPPFAKVIEENLHGIAVNYYYRSSSRRRGLRVAAWFLPAGFEISCSSSSAIFFEGSLLKPVQRRFDELSILHQARRGRRQTGAPCRTGEPRETQWGTTCFSASSNASRVNGFCTTCAPGGNSVLL